MNHSASDLIFEGLESSLDDWSVVAVEGNDRERFLQSQMTSDVAALEVGATQLTALLDRVGRLQAYGFLHKRAPRVDLLLPDEAVDAALEQLEAHIIADDVTLRRLDVPALRLLLGAEAVRLRRVLPEDETIPVEGWATRGCVTWSDVAVGLPAIDAEQLEARRMLSGPPRWGTEARSGSLIHESTLLKTAVSSDKGCYLGQETVAKVSSGRGAARAPMAFEIVDGDEDQAERRSDRFATADRRSAGELLGSAEWNGATFLVASVVRELRVEGLETELRFEDGSTCRVVGRAMPVLSAPDARSWASEIHLRAVEAFSNDREDEAVALLERAVAVCPDHADSYESWGVILGRLKRFDEAISVMHRLLDVDPASVMAHSNLSLYYNQLGRIEDAEREAAAAAHAKMESDRAARSLTEEKAREAHSAAEELERRATMFREVLAIDPDDPLGNYGLGELLAEQGRFEEAVRHLERALATDPGYSAAFLSLGKAQTGLGEVDAAIRTYRNGIKVAAGKGDLSTANTMQERLADLLRSGSN